MVLRSIGFRLRRLIEIDLLQLLNVLQSKGRCGHLSINLNGVGVQFESEAIAVVQPIDYGCGRPRLLGGVNLEFAGVEDIASEFAPSVLECLLANQRRARPRSIEPELAPESALAVVVMIQDVEHIISAPYERALLVRVV